MKRSASSSNRNGRISATCRISAIFRSSYFSLSFYFVTFYRRVCRFVYCVLLCVHTKVRPDFLRKSVLVQTPFLVVIICRTPTVLPAHFSSLAFFSKFPSNLARGRIYIASHGFLRPRFRPVVAPALKNPNHA